MNEYAADKKPLANGRFRQRYSGRLQGRRIFWPVLIVLAVMAFTAFALLNYDAADPQIGRYKAALDKHQYTEAGRYFAEDIRGDLNLEQAAQGLVVQEIEHLKEAYAAREINEDTIRTALEQMRQAMLLADTELLDLAETELSVLQASQQAFDEARRLEDEGNLGEAIRLYQQVQLLDPNYEEAQVRLDGLRGTYIRVTETNARKLLDQGKIPEALSLLDQAQTLMPGEERLAELREIAGIRQDQASRQSILDQSEQDRQNQDYTLALTRLSQARKIYPDDPSFVSLYADVWAEAEDTYARRADELWTSGQKDAALRTISEGLEIVQGSPYLLTMKDFYQENEPERATETNASDMEGIE